jgi:hypothetical protein
VARVAEVLLAFAIGALPALRAEYPGPGGLAGEMLEAHNEVRSRLGLPPVDWDGELARRAQDWANALIAGRGLEHSPRQDRPGEGENLARIDGGHTSATALFSGWASEGGAWTYGPLDCGNPNWGATGHYIQIIWRDTRRIGCAMAFTNDSQVLVCRYAPAGNICGEAPY